jgi:hypothetical protein
MRQFYGMGRSGAKSVPLLGILLLSIMGRPAIIIGQEGIALSYRQIWDPDTLMRKESQFLGRTAGTGSSGMIWGDHDEIFISDSFNSRILRVTTKGDVLQIIGSHGRGAGEFIRPSSIGFDESSGMLWVLDTEFHRFSRFDLLDNKFVYRDSFIFPGADKEFVLENENEFWQGGYSSLISRPDPPSLQKRLKLLDMTGGIVCEFGDLWFVDNDSPWSLLDDAGRNNGLLIELKNGRIAWLWTFRPIIEIWDKQGGLIVERQITDTYANKPPPQRNYSGIVQAIGVFGVAAYDRDTDVLFIKTPLEGGGGTQYIGLDTQTLREVERYHFKAGSVNSQNPVSETNILVRRENGIVHFYSIDRYTLSLIVLFPA